MKKYNMTVDKALIPSRIIAAFEGLKYRKRKPVIGGAKELTPESI